MGLHLEQITDLAWSPDGLALAISSYDGYCRQANLPVKAGSIRSLAPAWLSAGTAAIECLVESLEGASNAIADPMQLLSEDFIAWQAGCHMLSTASGTAARAIASI